MSRNLFVVSFILSAILIAYIFQGNKFYFLIVFSFTYPLEILRLRYMRLNWRQILLTLLLGPFTFLLGRESDYWWKMWQKDAVEFAN